MWTEECKRLDTDKSKYRLGGRERNQPGSNNAPPCLTWLLDNGSTCHIADELEVLPYCFNVREEHTVIKAVKDIAVATSYRRADMAVHWKNQASDGPSSAVVLLTDIVLLRRPRADYALCNSQRCPKVAQKGLLRQGNPCS